MVYIVFSYKPLIGNQVKHTLIIISILLLSSFLTSCEKKNGPGTETYKDGSSYVGVFKDGERNGQGTYTYSDGDKYEGEWKDGKYDGQGTETWSSGWKYVGEWREGKPWNITIYGKSRIIIMKYVNGVEQK